MNKFNFIKDFDFSKLDFVLVTLFLVLGFFGLLILSSASAHFSDSIYGNPSDIFNRQFFYFILGIIGLSICFFVPLNFWSSYDRLFITFGILLLFLVFVVRPILVALLYHMFLIVSSGTLCFYQ